MIFEKTAINSACDKALKAIAQGDRNALTVIYDKLHKLIYSAAWSILKSHEDAEDVLQNTLCEITKSAVNYKGGNARAYVLAIARNQALNLLRRRSFENPCDDIQKNEKSNVESEYIYLEALSTLNPREREAVVLKVYCSLKHKEIAEIMDITPSAAEKLYQRGVAKLRDYYK